jgi:STE24 endopeptidase
MSLVAQVFAIPEAWFKGLSWVTPDQLSFIRDVFESVSILVCLGVFFWIVFGHLSRRFERQADIFGCKVVSCNAHVCPPHFDLEDLDPKNEPTRNKSPVLCPVGIQIFTDALAAVARQNGIDATARSWRHGSIANRLAFLHQLQLNPAREPLFQTHLRFFRVALSAFLLLTLVMAVVTRSWELVH